MTLHLDWPTRSCPACQSSNFSYEPEFSSSKRAENLSFDEVREMFIGLRRKQIFFSYHRCLNCKLLFCPRYFSENQLDILYSLMPDNLMDEDKSVVSKTQTSYVKWFSKHVSNISNYLELGPDIGLVTEAIVNSFRIRSAILVEPNLEAHPQLRRLATSIQDIEIVRDLNDLEGKGGVDSVVAIHVLDHLLDPISTLNSILSLSTEDCSLLLVVHDEKSLLRKILHSSWPPFCLQHPQLFNKKTLKAFLARNGWQVETHGKTVNWQNLKHFAKLTTRILGIPASLTRFLPSVEIPLRLGNQIVVAKPDKAKP